MTPTLPLGHEPLGLELGAERLGAERRFRVIHERNLLEFLRRVVMGYVQRMNGARSYLSVIWGTSICKSVTHLNKIVGSVGSVLTR